jgi:hypothetical protein
MPYFDKLFSEDENGNKRFADGQKRELEMEDDPEAFVKLVRLVLTRSKSGYIEYLADFYGVKLEENGVPCLLSKSHPQIIPKQKTIQRSIIIAEGLTEGSCIVPPCQKVRSLQSVYDRRDHQRDLRTSVTLLNEEIFPVNPFQSNLTSLVPAINDRLGPEDLELTIRIPLALSVNINVLLTFVVVQCDE